jgi:hypothetical protein
MKRLKMKKKKIIILCLVFLLFIVAVFFALYSQREVIIDSAGSFMAPTGDYRADIAILEGTDFISTGSVEAGIDLLRAGRVKKILIVVQRIAPAHRPFGIDGDYPNVLGATLLDRGLRQEDFRVIVVPVRSPITLKEAEFVIKELAPLKARDAILVAPSFHTRRSYLCYSYFAAPLNIKIYPLAVFTEHDREKWWEDKKSRRTFGDESLKLIYYLAAGHIPFKFSY